MNVSNGFSKCCIWLFSFLIIFSFTLFNSQQALAKSKQKIVSIDRIDDLVVSDMLAQKKPETFELTLSSNGKTFDITLEPNKKLLKKLKRNDHNSLVLYKGKVNGIVNSWVRLSDNSGVYSGAIYDGKELYFVDPATTLHQAMSDSQFEQYAIQSDTTQVMYKASDVNNSGLCGAEHHNQSSSSFNYQEYVDELSVMANSLATREIEVALVADTEFNAVHSGNAADRMLIEMNIVDGIFSEQVNVQMSVVYSSVLSDNGPLTMTNAVDLVYAFRDYAFQEVGNPGVTHLFTGKNLDSNTVGIAFVSALCTSYGIGVTQNLGSSTALVAAHEFGHNFGAPHDNYSDSACSSTPGGFLMNPSINGSDQFSNCSLVQMDNHINQANGYTNNQCVVDIDTSVAPIITSTPSVTAIVGIEYSYDADSTVEVTGTTPITYNLDIAPAGMSIDANGAISWTPDVTQVGIHTVQISVSNQAGNDSQFYDVTVLLPRINFEDTVLSSYGGKSGDTSKGTVTIEDSGATLNLSGNRWQKIDFPYNITTNTILEFDFKSTKKGDIHGIGFDDDTAISADKTFVFDGNQSFGLDDFNYTGNGEYQHFVIPVGEFYSGAMQNLFFVMDNDVSNPLATSIFSNVIVYEAAGTPPTIISTANTNATVGSIYNYDADGLIDVSGTTPITYTLDLNPTGMTVDGSGLISWTPEAFQEGIETVQITASNEFGSDTQSFDILVSPPLDSSILNFNTFSLSSYGGKSGDTSKGTVTIEDSGATLNLTGNRWQKIHFAYNISLNTILEFDFKSTAIGDIHGIGFDDDTTISADKTFVFDGNQSFGLDDFSYTGNGEYQHFVIPVGEFYSGAMQNLFFVMDNDVSNPAATSIFSNISVYESANSAPSIISTANTNASVGIAYAYDADGIVDISGTTPITVTLDLFPAGMTIDNSGLISWTPEAFQEGIETIQITVTNEYGSDTQSFDILVSPPLDPAILNFNAYSLSSYGGKNGDTNKGTVTISESGATINLTGNRWQKIELPFNITANTVLEFDFKSTKIGDIHGIGFDDDIEHSTDKTFKLFGTQSYGITDFSYVGNGEYQHFVIPVGQYYTGAAQYLFLVMDNDTSNPSATSMFRNIKVSN